MDALVAAKAAYYTFGELKMWKRCLLLIADGVDGNGNFRTVVPSGDSFMKLTDQNLYWVHSCMEYCMISKDMDFARTVRSKIYDFLSLCERYITEEDLFAPPDFTWHWVDWANIDRRPYSLPINCILIKAAESAAKIAEFAKDNLLRDLADRIVKRIRPQCARFYDRKRGIFITHIEPLKKDIPYNAFGFMDKEDVTPISIHSVLLACDAQCGSEQMRKGSVACLNRIMENPYAPEVLMGPGWAEILLSQLVKFGYAETAEKYIKAHFGKIAESGQKTFPEAFQRAETGAKPDAGTSAKADAETEANIGAKTAHAWGSSVNSLLAVYQEEFGVNVVKRKH